MQKILSYMRKAIEDYNMIEDGDKIAVALSGGKDSISMLMGLKALQRFYPKKFDLIAVSINPGFDFFDKEFLEKKCKEIDVPLFIEDTNIKEIVFDVRKEKNPCSLCANFRRINTFSPISYMDRSKITLIRPLIYAPEKYIKNFVKKNNVEIMNKVCPVDGISKREDIKEMIKNLKTDIPHIRANLYGAIKRNIPGWKKEA